MPVTVADFSMLRLVLVLALSAIAVSGCDSAEPPPPIPPPPVQPPPVTPPPITPPPPVLLRFTFPEVPALLSYEAGEQVSITPLSFFGSLPAPSDVAFAAQSTGSAVTIRSTPTAVTITAAAEGTAALAVTFAAAGYRDSTVTVPVEVVPATCPPAPPPGARDFFPAVPGAAWTFGYGSNEFASGTPVDIINATLTLTFGAPTCLRGLRTWTVAQRLTGTRRSSTFGATSPYSAQATATATENAQNEVDFSLAVPAGLTHNATIRRFRTTPGGGTLGVSGTTSCPRGSYAPSVEFEPGVGLTREGMSCVTSVGVLERFMTRVP